MRGNGFSLTRIPPVLGLITLTCLLLYRRIRAIENLYSRIFYAGNRKECYHRLMNTPLTVALEIALLAAFLKSCCSGHHCCTRFLKKTWTQVLRRFKSCFERFWVLRWWKSLYMVMGWVTHVKVRYKAYSDTCTWIWICLGIF